MLKKFGLAVVSLAAFGLVACGDDSSSASAGDVDGSVNCDVTTKGNTVTMTYGMKGLYTNKISITIDGDKLTMESETYGGPEASLACKAAEEEARKDGEDVSIKCKGDMIYVTETDDSNGTTLDEIKDGLEMQCKVMSADGDFSDLDFGGLGGSEDGDDEEDGKSSSSKGGDEDIKSSSSVGGNALPGDMQLTPDMVETLLGAEGIDLDSLLKEAGMSKEDFGSILESINNGGDYEKILDSLGFGDLIPGANEDDPGFSITDNPLDNLPECTAASEGSKETIDYSGFKLYMVCTDGEWVTDEQAMSESLGISATCDFAESDNVWTFTKTMMGMTVVTKYEWTSDTEVKETETVMGLSDTETLSDVNKHEMYEEVMEECKEMQVP